MFQNFVTSILGNYPGINTLMQLISHSPDISNIDKKIAELQKGLRLSFSKLKFCKNKGVIQLTHIKTNYCFSLWNI